LWVGVKLENDFGSTFPCVGVTIMGMTPSEEANGIDVMRVLRQMINGVRTVRIFSGLCALLFVGQVAAANEKPDRTSVGDTKVALKDISGEERRPFALGDEKASVLFFVLHDCPVANAYAPEIRRVVESYEKKKVRFALVYVDPDLTVAEIEKHRKQYGHQGYPAFFDKKHVLVKATGADVTPEAAVIGKDGRIVYRGRISNLYADYGKRRRIVTEHDLRDALDAVLAGKPVAKSRTRAIGCFIPEAN
jgi:thiol-disulfide isomerase/thioredoxin